MTADDHGERERARERARGSCAARVPPPASGAGSRPSTTRRSGSLRRHGLRVLHHRGARGPADPRPARPARRHAAERRPVQPGLHDARRHDGLPVRDADVGGVLQLPDPADDRRARRGLPSSERLQLLGVPAGRALPVLELLPRRRAERRLVRLRAELDHRPVDRHDVLRARSDHHRHRLDRGRGEPGRHGHQHARAGHDAVPHAGVRVDGARGAVAARVLAADHHGRAVPAAVRPASSGHSVLRSDRAAATRCCGSTCSGSSAIPRSTS